MATLPVVDENTSARLRVTLLDFDDVQAVPASATYTVVSVDDGTVLRASTALVPAGQIDIILAGTVDNIVVDDTLEFERHRVTVSAVYGGDDELHGQYDYLVKNLSQVT